VYLEENESVAERELETLRSGSEKARLADSEAKRDYRYIHTSNANHAAELLTRCAEAGPTAARIC
jgi:hypothetical protein